MYPVILTVFYEENQGDAFIDMDNDGRDSNDHNLLSLLMDLLLIWIWVKQAMVLTCRFW